MAVEASYNKTAELLQQKSISPRKEGASFQAVTTSIGSSILFQGQPSRHGNANQNSPLSFLPHIQLIVGLNIPENTIGGRYRERWKQATTTNNVTNEASSIKNGSNGGNGTACRVSTTIPRPNGQACPNRRLDPADKLNSTNELDLVFRLVPRQVPKLSSLDRINHGRVFHQWTRPQSKLQPVFQLWEMKKDYILSKP
ncbi:Hypothetical predicted protein [Prunus dulcis]|uniref:Uncharacterized protein n=1 Tax=Prunus dulcis TaxID=3755 RepID=A0A5E4FKF8_PRUDU|nr:hypothetical protein L3X38_011417 [Prunus dulcis]VVA28226.1 Hypothetical predicted protein [Prunus dulcis]VVA28227.1 Hypothetical predicted protein [Prunus dulcis]